MFELKVETKNRSELIDITDQIERILSEKGIKNSFIYIFCPHTTAGLVINEGYDENVSKDFVATMNELIPWENNYKHLEGNSAAHIKSILTGCSLDLYYGDKQLDLGRWQRVFLAEFDGPRKRTIKIREKS
ncbi:MAG: secondary thiamine-phosphate synthase enzyme YjbQ [Bacillota bacterium]